jgi:Heat shock protein
MRSTTFTCLAASMAALTLIACAKAPEGRAPEAGVSQQQSTPSSPLADREWALVMLGDSVAPLGAGDRPATIRFDSAAARASGFAGCNRYSASYTAIGDSIHFGPAVSTKMACATGDDLERRFLGMIPEVTNYQVTDSTLSLGGASGPLARFRVQ